MGGGGGGGAWSSACRCVLATTPDPAPFAQERGTAEMVARPEAEALVDRSDATRHWACGGGGGQTGRVHRWREGSATVDIRYESVKSGVQEKGRANGGLGPAERGARRSGHTALWECAPGEDRHGRLRGSNSSTDARQRGFSVSPPRGSPLPRQQRQRRLVHNPQLSDMGNGRRISTIHQGWTTRALFSFPFKQTQGCPSERIPIHFCLGECRARTALAVHTQCKPLCLGNYLSPSFGLFSPVGCSITDFFYASYGWRMWHI